MSLALRNFYWFIYWWFFHFVSSVLFSREKYPLLKRWTLRLAPFIFLSFLLFSVLFCLLALFSPIFKFIFHFFYWFFFHCSYFVIFKSSFYSEFSLYIVMKVKVKVKLLSRVGLFVTLWTVTHQAPQSMGFSRQEYWSGVPFPSPGDLPDPGIKPRSPALEADILTSETPGKPIYIVIAPFKKVFTGVIFFFWFLRIY